MRRAQAMAVGCAAAALCACTPDFQAPSQVTDLRILAVQAEPPEAQYDASSVDSVQVTVLAVDPAHPGALVMDAALCGPTDSRRCDVAPVFPLGLLPLQTTIAVPPQALAAAVASDKLQGYGGIRVQLAFSIDDGDPAGPQFADKILLYTPRGGTPNHNPLLTSVQLSLDGAAQGTLTPGQTLQLPVGVQIGLRPVLAPGARETYQVQDLQGHLITLTEDPAYAFFTLPGAQFDRDTATEPIDGVAPPDGLTRIASTQRGSGTFWIVVRDGRGGESWLSFPWSAN